MTLTCTWNATYTTKMVARLGAYEAFRVFRHEATDYDVLAAAAGYKTPAYRALALEVAKAALQRCGNNEFKAVVANWASRKFKGQ